MFFFFFFFLGGGVVLLLFVVVFVSLVLFLFYSKRHIVSRYVLYIRCERHLESDCLES